MTSIRQENNICLQNIAAQHLALLLEQCQQRGPSPNDKILSNLCTVLRCDSDFTPVIHRPQNDNNANRNNHCKVTKANNYNGIVTLCNQQRNAERAVFKRSNSTGRGPGRPPASDVPLEEIFKEDDEHQRANQIQRRGATLALVAITKHFAESLPVKAPKLWEYIVGQLSLTMDPYNFVPSFYANKDDDAEKLVWALQVRPEIHHAIFPLKISLELTI